MQAAEEVTWTFHPPKKSTAELPGRNFLSYFFRGFLYHNPGLFLLAALQATPSRYVLLLLLMTVSLLFLSRIHQIHHQQHLVAKLQCPACQ